MIVFLAVNMCPTPDDEGVNGLANGSHANGTNGHVNANGVNGCELSTSTLYVNTLLILHMDSTSWFYWY